jgi:hypothetical protein
MQHTFKFRVLVASAVFMAGACSQTSAADLTDNQIRDILVRSSIALYDGACACPTSLDNRGKPCGDRSAYKKDGHGGVLCARSDVKADTIKKYRELSK